jgi:hypothetical protein
MKAKVRIEISAHRKHARPVCEFWCDECPKFQPPEDGGAYGVIACGDTDPSEPLCPHCERFERESETQLMVVCGYA